MAQTTITASEARAQVLLENAANWSRGTAVTRTGETIGVVLFASGSRPGVVYMTRQDGEGGCSCPAYQRGFRQCCHVRAVRADVAQAREAVTVKPRTTYDQLLDAQLDEGTRTVAILG
jgi:predicted nucleic acid-binding Zn finger protein